MSMAMSSLPWCLHGRVCVTSSFRTGSKSVLGARALMTGLSSSSSTTTAATTKTVAALSARSISSIAGGSGCFHLSLSTTAPLAQRHRQQQQQQLQVRSFATGSRGARGHGWYVKYRAGEGGRHLQGEYVDRPDVTECQAWNEAVLALGSRRVYMDIVLEPRNSEAYAQMNRNDDDNNNKESEDGSSTSRPKSSKLFRRIPPVELLTGTKTRLYMDIAETVMPKTCDNFLQLLQKDYKGSALFRLQRNVGICGGDILTNTGRTGKAAVSDVELLLQQQQKQPKEEAARPILSLSISPLRVTVKEDPLVMWHVPGTVTMIVASVDQVDSRYLFCTDVAPHLDGIYRAFGVLTPESLQAVQNWQSTLLTRDSGVPSSFELIVADCGILSSEDQGDADEDQQGKKPRSAVTAEGQASLQQAASV